MSWDQAEQCKTCEYWKDSYEGCYMYRGGFCPDKKKYYKPLYSMLEQELTKSIELNKDLLTLLYEIKICLDSGVEINPTSFFHSQINLLIDKYVSLT